MASKTRFDLRSGLRRFPSNCLRSPETKKVGEMACLLKTDQQMEIVSWEKIISPRASAKNGNSTLGKSFAFQPMQLKFFPGEEFCHDLKVCVIAFLNC